MVKKKKTPDFKKFQILKLILFIVVCELVVFGLLTLWGIFTGFRPALTFGPWYELEKGTLQVWGTVTSEDAKQFVLKRHGCNVNDCHMLPDSLIIQKGESEFVAKDISTEGVTVNLVRYERLPDFTPIFFQSLIIAGQHSNPGRQFASHVLLITPFLALLFWIKYKSHF